jgi:hypothetical protein
MTKGIRLFAAAAAVAVASMSLAPAAHAAEAAWMSEEASEAADVLNAGVAPEGKTTWGQSLNFTGPGKLTVSAYDLGVAGTLLPPLEPGGLSFSVSSAAGLLGWHAGDGVMAFDILGPGNYFVTFSATPDQSSRFKLPLVSWSLSFEADASAVPLPASVWLLVAGLAWATGMQRKRAKLARREESVRWDAPVGAQPV